MKLFLPDELPGNPGDIMLLYGETGVGKSVTCLQTAPDPIVHFMTESRDPRKFLIAAQRPDLRVKFGFYENWDDTISFFSDPKNTAKARTIIIDSITFLSNVQLVGEITEETFEALDEKEKKEKGLIKATKMSMEGWGGLSGQLQRFTNIVSKLSQDGKIIIFLALLEENPRFNRSLAAGPALKGKDFPKVLPGFCDFIGMVEPRLDGNSDPIFPPRVRFQSDGTFMAKWTGVQVKAQGPLHIQKILELAHGGPLISTGKGVDKKIVKAKADAGPETDPRQLSLPGTE